MDFTHLNSIMTFFVISIGLGYGVLWFSKAKTDSHILIRLLEVLAIGIASFSFLAVIFNLAHIPLTPLSYLTVALVCAAIPLIFNVVRKSDDPVIGDMRATTWLSQTTWCVLALFVIMVAFFFVYNRGANAYPYLEDDDSWNHAQGSMYVATQHTYSVDPALRLEWTVAHGYAQYLEPYPPTYDALMGVLRQTNDSILWTLKFFNVLLITIGLAFFYLFFRAFMHGPHSDLKALFATFILAALPSFMSHFIWNQTLAIILIPVALYAALRALDDPSWRASAIIATASAFVTQPVISLVLGIILMSMFGLVAVHEMMARKQTKGKGNWFERTQSALPQTWSLFLVGIGGGILSMLFWGAQLFKWGMKGIMDTQGGAVVVGSGDYTIQKYTLNELLFPPFASRIDQATGWGIVVTLLLVIAIIAIVAGATKTLNLRRDWRTSHALLIFVLTAYLVFAPSFGLPSFWTSRAWPLLAIPLALIATIGAFIIINSLTRNKVMVVGALIIIGVGIAMTSIPAKIAVQTAQWPPGAQWSASTEITGYLQMQQAIPKGSRIYPVCGGDQRSLGFDMRSDPWDSDTVEMRKLGLNFTPSALVSFLSTKRYEYVTFDATCVRDNGENATAAIVNDLATTGRFQQVMSSPGFLLVKFV